MTLAEFRTRLRAMLGDPSVGDVSNTTLDSMINRAYREIMDKYMHHMSRVIDDIVTVDGTADYTLPADCFVVISLWDTTNKVKLWKRDDLWLEGQQNQQNGKPEGYVRYRDYITLSPTPDDAYTLRLFYKAATTDLAADGDTPVLNPSWDDGILFLARFKFYDEKGDAPKAQYAWSVYKAWVEEKPSEIMEEQFHDYDAGVRVPTLKQSAPRYDFDQSD